MVGELEVRRNSLLLVLVVEDGGGCVTVCGGLDRSSWIIWLAQSNHKGCDDGNKVWSDEGP